MNEMVTALFDISLITQTAIHREKCDLTQKFKSIIDECRVAEPAREVEVIVNEDLQIEADKKLIHVALANLIRNAWKFTQFKTPGRIEFGITKHKESTAFFLRDNGAGFDMKGAGKMFTIFRRFHPDSAYEGTGIGLATVHKIIQSHGGKIWAEAEVEKGATFYFTVG
jgi:light-regulated signal transduction histidine kinase (bacteriophytochrome)